MLAIRMQRVGRKGHAMYRLVVQEAQKHPSSGRVITYVGSYDPHAKTSNVQVDVAQKYLDNGAQPSPRVIKLLKDAGVKLPAWVKEPSNKNQKAIRNPEKLRKNRPVAEEVKVEKPVAIEEPIVDEPAEEVAEAEEATEQSEEVIEEPEESVEESAPKQE